MRKFFAGFLLVILFAGCSSLFFPAKKDKPAGDELTITIPGSNVTLMMKLIKAGEFLMGSPDTESLRRTNEDYRTENDGVGISTMIHMTMRVGVWILLVIQIPLILTVFYAAGVISFGVLARLIGIGFIRRCRKILPSVFALYSPKPFVVKL